MRAGIRGRLPMVVTAAVASALVLGGVARSAPGDPKSAFTAAGQAAAKTGVLQKSDLPKGAWKAAATDFSQPNPACFVQNYSLAALTMTGEAGFTYSQGSGVPSIESDVHVFLTAAQAKRAVGILAGTDLGRCEGSALVSDFTASANGRSGKVLAVEPLTIAGATFATRTVVQLHTAQGDLVVDMVDIGIRKGGALAGLHLLRFNTVWPMAVLRSLAQKTSARLSKH